jgi:uncharacterized delta-60 repeat protein
MKCNKLCIIVGIVLLPAITHAASGALDTTFGNNGFTLTPLSRADILPSGIIQTALYETDKIVVAGSTSITAPSLLVAQYTSNGILDTGNFNSAGSTPGYQVLLPSALSPAATICAGNAVALDASSNILVAGYATQSPTTMLLARYTAAGALDTTFNSTGFVTQSVGTGEGATANAVGVQSATYSNRIILAGTSINNGVPSFTLAALNASSGALDTTFPNGSGPGYVITTIGNISTIKAMIIPSSGIYQDYIIVVGVVDSHITIARYTPTGVLDATFNGTGIFQPTITGTSSSNAYDVTIDSSNNILAAGSAKISGTNASLLMRVTPVGVLDATFNAPHGYVLQSISYGSEFYALAIQANTSIVAGGYAIGGLENQISLARYLTNGTLDSTYGTAGISLTTIGTLTAAQTVLIQSTQKAVTTGTADGTIYVARFLS